jgi:hypothetical protein
MHYDKGDFSTMKDVYVRFHESAVVTVNNVRNELKKF